LSQSAICCIAATNRISHCLRFGIGGNRVYPTRCKIEGRFRVVFLPNRPVIADKVMIGQAFRNASFDGGKVTLWVKLCLANSRQARRQ
jgi:hypothetical protein